MPDTRLVATRMSEVDDDMLQRLSSSATTGDFRGPSPRVDARPQPENPFDLGVAKPRAIDITKLYKLAGKKPPTNIQASLGPRVPLMLCHSLTPFYKPGGQPVGVWGMGYTIVLRDVDGATVSVCPESSLLKVAQINQKVNLGLNVGGKIGVPAAGLEVLDAVPGLSLTGAEVRATTDQDFALAIQCSFAVLEVQAGPLGSGGARWNLYRAAERIDVCQPLFHTLLVPTGVQKLHVTIETWVRRPRRLFNLFRAEHFHYPAVEYDISMDGL